MQQSEGTFASATGKSIYYQSWSPESAPRALILITHGAGEYSGRYRGFAEHFVTAGYAVAAHDHPGHGRSDGTRGFLRSLEEYKATLAEFQTLISARYPGLPVILLGHSMGGLISALYLLDHQTELAGCIFSGAAIRSDLQPPKIQLLLIRLLSRLLPKLGVLQLDPAGISRDPQEVQRYVSDPMIHHGKLSARLVAELFRGMGIVDQNVGRITLPLYIFHGGADPMTAPAGSQFLYEHAGSGDKTLKIYPELFHEPFNEAEREEVFADIQHWCDALLTATAPVNQANG